MCRRCDSLKAQSAIEYLTTYGWMLIAVSVAGGAVYSTVGSECIESSTGFTGSDVAVEDFGFSNSNSMDLVISNNAQDDAEIDEVEINSSTGEYRIVNGTEIAVGSEDVVTIPAVESSSECNSFDVSITYSQGPLENQVISGSLTTSARLLEIDPPAAPSGLSATY